MAVARRRSEFGVELHADEEGMTGELHYLGQVLAGGARRDLVALRLELRHVDIVNLIAVTMALVHLCAVNGRGQRPRLDRTLLRAQAHSAAEIRCFGAPFDPAGGVGPL